MWNVGTCRLDVKGEAHKTLSDYENYRSESLQDADCISAFEYAEKVDCIVSYERSFYRPIFP